MHILSKFIALALIAVHWITKYLQNGSEWINKSVTAVKDAHKAPIWIFAERNTIPWIKGNQCNQDNISMNNSYPMTYYPETNKLILNSRTNESDKGTFGDVVTAELVNSDRILCFDMSSFFHEITWNGAKNMAPSLYEVVLLYCLNRNMVFTKDSMKGLVLEVLTAEGKELQINICNSKDNFAGWEKYEKAVNTVNTVEDDEASIPDETEA